MRSKDTLRKGRLVGKVLSGSWRKINHLPIDFSETDLEEVTPLLYASGTAPLGWRRVSSLPLKDSASAELLHQAYRLQSLHSEMQERKIQRLFKDLNDAGVEAILAKGWASARQYPDRTLRPYGDIDICVRPAQFKLTEELLSRVELRDCWVDLHQQFSEIDDRTFDQIFDRSQVVTLGSESVRILALEDQLALSCIHLLRHGAWRPLWLCDVGVAMENLPPDFDWDMCLGANQTRANWIVCAIELARELLGADTARLERARANASLPVWLTDNVLKQWENPTAINQPPMSHPVPITQLLKQRSGLVQGLRQRWPNPILATISVNGRFNEYPRLPYQMANCISRVGRAIFNRPNQAHEH